MRIGAPIIVSLTLMVVIIAFVVIKYRELPESVTSNPRPLPATVTRNMEKPIFHQPEMKPKVEEENDDLPLVEAPLSVNGSDRTVRSAVRDLSIPLVDWLAKEELVRKTVLAVNLLAEGKVPNTHRPVTFQPSGFAAVVLPKDEALTDSSKKRYLSDISNDRRSTVFVDVVTAISPERVAKYLKQWGGVLELAHSELGRTETFKDRMNLALERVIAAEPAPKKAVLVRPKVFFQYANPSLEAATDLKKWLWRLGPENQKKLQDFALQLQAELNR